MGREVGVGETVGTGWAVLEAVCAALLVASAVWTGGVSAGVKVEAGRAVGPGVGRVAVRVADTGGGVGVTWSEQAASSARTKGRRQIKERICLDILLDSQFLCKFLLIKKTGAV